MFPDEGHTSCPVTGSTPADLLTADADRPVPAQLFSRSPIPIRTPGFRFMYNAYMTCITLDCDKPAKSRGLCGTCYQRERRAGKFATTKPACGCDKPLYARGLCSTCYWRRWYNSDLPDKTERFDTFITRVNKTDTCWLWSGNKNSNGYGLVSIDGKTVQVHRYAYEVLVGPIPDGLTIDHLCRVRLCVNPDHLEVVTLGENIRRALKTGPRCGCDPSNFFTRKDGRVECRLCRNRRSRNWKRRNRAKK